MTETRHYLEQELLELVRADDRIFLFLQEGSLDGIWFWDLQSPEDEWMSERFWTTLGYDPTPRRHKAAEWQDLIHPEDLKLALQNFEQHCEDPSHPYDQIVRYRHADGSTVWVRCRGLAIRDEAGVPVRMLGCHTDVTELKVAEQRLAEEARIKLQTAEARWSAVVSTTPDLVVGIDLEGVIRSWNPAAERATGYPPTDAIGHPLARVIPEDRLEEMQSVLAAMRAGETVTALETQHVDRDGHRHDVELSMAPIRVGGPEGELLGCAAIGRDISERKRSEQRIEALNQALSARAEELQAVLDATPSAMLLVDRQLRVLLANDAAAPLLTADAAPDEAGSERRELRPELDPLRDHWARAFAGEALDLDRVPIGPSDRRRWMKVSFRPLDREGGAPRSVLFSGTDITQAIALGEQVEESERRLRDVVEGTGASIVKVDAAGEVEYANHGREEKADSPELSSEMQAAVREVLRTGEAAYFRSRATDAESAADRHELHSLSPQRQGAETRGVTIVSTDITRTLELESELESSAELRRLGLVAGGFGTWEWDRASSAGIRWDENQRRIFGWEPGTTPRDFEEFVEGVHPKDRAGLLARRERALQAQDDYEDSFRFRRRSDGALRWYSFRASFARDESGQVISTRGVGWDSTAEQLARRERERLIEDLRDKNKELERFVYIASHDLQAPLRALAGFAEFLEEDCADQLDETGRGHLAQIRRGAARMRSLIQGLVTYSRSRTSTQDIAPVDLGALLDDVLDGLSHEVREAEAQLQISELPTVHGDAAQLRLLFQNLVSNALKYRGEGPAQLQIDCQQEGDHWRLRFFDQGIGIAPRHQERIFELFRRLHDERAYPGTGLGLTICRTIVGRHGGEMGVESEEGEGASFWFTLPRDPATLVDPPSLEE